jgi:hypothetical protein
MNQLLKDAWCLLFIQGQHELQGAYPWLLSSADENRRMHLDYHAMSRNFTDVGGVAFYGLDWCPSFALQDQLDRIVPPESTKWKRVLVLHQVCVPAMVSTEFFQDTPHQFVSTWSSSSLEVTDRDAKISQKLQIIPTQLNDYMVPDWVDLVIVGDTHKHTVFTLRSKSGNLIPCLSPGALAMQAVNELSFGKAFVLYSDLSFESLNFETRPVVQIRVDTDIDFDSAIQSAYQLRDTITLPIPDHLVPIVVVTIAKPNADKWSQLRAAYTASDGTKLAHLFPQVEKQQGGGSQDITQSVAEAASMLQSVDALIDYAVADVTRDDEVVRELIDKLINNSSVDFVLAGEWRRHLEKYTNAT